LVKSEKNVKQIQSVHKPNSLSDRISDMVHQTVKFQGKKLEEELWAHQDQELRLECIFQDCIQCLARKALGRGGEGFVLTPAALIAYA
jgi:hypothetical protein